MEHRVPDGIGISRITAVRQRAEYSRVGVSYYSYSAGRWVDDASIEIGNHSGDEREFALVTPEAFRSGLRPLLIRIDGWWTSGGVNYWYMPKTTFSQRVDRFIVYFFTGRNDPDANMIITLYYDRPIPPMFLEADVDITPFQI